MEIETRLERKLSYDINASFANHRDKNFAGMKIFPRMIFASGLSFFHSFQDMGEKALV